MFDRLIESEEKRVVIFDVCRWRSDGKMTYFCLFQAVSFFRLFLLFRFCFSLSLSGSKRSQPISLGSQYFHCLLVSSFYGCCPFDSRRCEEDLHVGRSGGFRHFGFRSRGALSRGRGFPFLFGSCVRRRRRGFYQLAVSDFLLESLSLPFYYDFHRCYFHSSGIEKECSLLD